MTQIVELNDLLKQGHKEQKKPIELMKYLKQIGEIQKYVVLYPKDFDYISLVSRGASGEYDIIMCWNNSNAIKSIYLGHWNDGVIE